CDIEYTYADRNFTATGSYTDTESGNKFVYNAFLVRGWNILYVIATEKDGVRTYTLTTSNPGGLSWSFE
ncbi:MAG: hypothetical protein LBK94_08285, partial [Prevotellaceae bacterium]|nr:hypothetical protein [Prevotellaceae bacterium]